MQQAIGYTRVSTAQQKRSGLGLEAQRKEIERFALAEGYTIASWYQDIQTGKGADALNLRPGLRAALSHSRKLRSPLIVAKLDRLARNSHFITGLIEDRVRFIVTEHPIAEAFELQLRAAMAEKEAKLISERTKAALARLRLTKKLGMAGKTRAQQSSIRSLALAAKDQAASARAEALRPQIEFAFKPGEDGKRITLKQAAEILNSRGIESPMGGHWHAPSLLKAAKRLGLR
jgi:DNA invertase Pin-like site-specific DNA recombinase